MITSTFLLLCFCAFVSAKQVALIVGTGVFQLSQPMEAGDSLELQIFSADKHHVVEVTALSDTMACSGCLNEVFDPPNGQASSLTLMYKTFPEGTFFFKDLESGLSLTVMVAAPVQPTPAPSPAPTPPPTPMPTPAPTTAATTTAAPTTAPPPTTTVAAPPTTAATTATTVQSVGATTTPVASVGATTTTAAAAATTAATAPPSTAPTSAGATTTAGACGGMDDDCEACIGTAGCGFCASPGFGKCMSTSDAAWGTCTTTLYGMQVATGGTCPDPDECAVYTTCNECNAARVGGPDCDFCSSPAGNVCVYESQKTTDYCSNVALGDLYNSCPSTTTGMPTSSAAATTLPPTTEPLSTTSAAPTTFNTGGVFSGLCGPAKTCSECLSVIDPDALTIQLPCKWCDVIGSGLCQPADSDVCQAEDVVTDNGSCPAGGLCDSATTCDECAAIDGCAFCLSNGIGRCVSSRLGFVCQTDPDTQVFGGSDFGLCPGATAAPTTTTAGATTQPAEETTGNGETSSNSNSNNNNNSSNGGSTTQPGGGNTSADDGTDRLDAETPFVESPIFFVIIAVVALLCIICIVILVCCVIRRGGDDNGGRASEDFGGTSMTNMDDDEQPQRLEVEWIDDEGSSLSSSSS